MSRKKPWDEDWYSDFGDDEDDPIVRRSGDNMIQAAWIENEQRAKLLAAAPDLVRALLAVEWSGRPGDAHCEWCGAEGEDNYAGGEWTRTGEHFDDCRRQAALRKAGVL